MHALRRAVLDAARSQRALARPAACCRELGGLQALLGWEAGAADAVPDRHPTGQAPAAELSRRSFGTSAAACSRGRDFRRLGGGRPGTSSEDESELEDDLAADASLEREAADSPAAPPREAVHTPEADSSAGAGQLSVADSAEGPFAAGTAPPHGLDLSTPAERRAVLEQMRRGEVDVFGRRRDAEGAAETGAALREWLSYFRMKVVDVNRTSRGSPTGGIGRFSAMVVVGNSNGVLGLGVGKSEAMGDAVKKANNQALKTLFFVPRFNASTILHPVAARYGRVKVSLYPRSTGSGCRASNLAAAICQLAGVQDVGVKIHGTRNVRNMVKALIRGFESQSIAQEPAALPSAARQRKPRAQAVAG